MFLNIIKKTLIPILLSFVVIVILVFIGQINTTKEVMAYQDIPAFSPPWGTTAAINVAETSQTKLGDLTIGDSRNIAASIGSIHADYSIPSILDKKIKQLRINGLTLNLEIAAGRVIIPGLDLEKIAATNTKDEVSQASSSINLPLQLDKFQVKNGLLNILYEQQPILIPFSLQITRIEETDKDTQPAYQLNLQIFPQG